MGLHPQELLRWYVRCPHPGCCWEEAAGNKNYLAGRLVTHQLAEHDRISRIDWDAALAAVEDTLSVTEAQERARHGEQPELFPELQHPGGAHHAA